MDYRSLKSQLQKLSAGNEKFAEFGKRIINTHQTILGVRTPDLRRLAKTTAKDATFAEIKSLLNIIDDSIYEEVLLSGLIINYAHLADQEKLELTKIYLEKTDNWAQIDMFAEKQKPKPKSSQKLADYGKSRELWWNYSLETLKSPKEFIVRYGIMNLMSNYLAAEDLPATLSAIRSVHHDGYYVKMALAWLYATAAAQNFDLIQNELTKSHIDSWVRNKSYQKMLESYRITSEQKSQIRTLRAKNTKK